MIVAFVFVLFSCLNTFFILLGHRYENLVANPEQIMRMILAALDLPWNPAVLNFYMTNRTVHTHSMSRELFQNLCFSGEITTFIFQR